MKRTFILMSCLLAVSAQAQFVWNTGTPMKVAVPQNAAPVVQTALEILSKDAQTVLGDTLTLTQDKTAPIQLSIHEDGRHEGYTMKVTRDNKLCITGSDAHGLAYGILEVSRLLGVSPWEWWADVTPRPMDKLELPKGFERSHQPSVAYRGIFINDEDWGMQPWSCFNYEKRDFYQHTIGAKTNARIFELLLRLRANTFWPAMHECTVPFFLTPGNREAAKKYGIYIGGSHCEPMVSNAVGEWSRRGKGDYDYVHNQAAVYKFWEDRVREVADQEVLYTIGMRGVHDSGMQGVKGVEDQKQALTKIFKDQRELIAKYVNPDVTKVPQVFIPYKEVLEVYNAGLEVPDDVCLMWCDDNYGYVRHFPTEAERARKGGNGIYYHVSYWGRPHDYLWLGTFSPYLLYDQMKRSYDQGIQKFWILNVGDLKPAEYQIELFMDMAWDMQEVVCTGVSSHMKNFLCREFGAEIGDKLQPLMEESYRLAYIRKPEFMGNTRVEEKDPAWRVVKDMPWKYSYIDQRLKDYTRLSDEVESLYAKIPEDRQDAYFELVKYPIQGAAQLNRKLLYAQKARHGMMDWSASDAAYDSITALTRIYNTGIHNEGKWHRMMDCQPRRLPVFEPADRKNTIAATEIETIEPQLLARYNGKDAKGGAVIRCEGLGYEEGAAELMEEEAEYEFEAPKGCDSVLVEIRFVPTHPVDGKHLAANVAIGKSKPLSVDYHTEGRSEEWKENVLQNQAIRKVTLPCKAGKKQSVRLSANYQGVIVDQVLIYKPSSSHDR